MFSLFFLRLSRLGNITTSFGKLLTPKSDGTGVEGIFKSIYISLQLLKFHRVTPCYCACSLYKSSRIDVNHIVNNLMHSYDTKIILSVF